MRPDSGVSTGSAPSDAADDVARRAPGRRRRRAAAGASSCRPTAFSSSGVPSRDLAAVVDDRDPVGELVGLVEVLRRQQDGAAARRRGSRIVSHIWPRVRGSRPVVGSSRKISGGRVIRLAARSSRRRMPPENCEIGLVGGLLEPELLEQPLRGRAGVRRAQALQAPEEPQVLGRREVLVDRRVLAGDADQLADAVRLAGHVDAEDLRVARVDRQQRREHPQHRRLAGAVRAEDAEDLALAHLEVDAVDGAQVAEGLHQAACLDGRLS